MVPVRASKPHRAFAPFTVITPHRPKKSFLDFQRLTQIQPSILPPALPIFLTTLSLTKIATTSA